MVAKSVAVALVVVLVVGVAAYVLAGRAGGGVVKWTLMLDEGEVLLDEPIPVLQDGSTVYMVVTSKRALLISAETGEIVKERNLEGGKVGMGHRSGVFYVGIESQGLADVYAVRYDSSGIIVEGPLVVDVPPSGSVSNRGLWVGTNSSLLFYEFPDMSKRVVKPPAEYSEPLSISAYSLGDYEVVSVLSRNGSSLTYIFSYPSLEVSDVIENFVVADTISGERGDFILAVYYTGDESRGFSVTYLIDVYKLRGGKHMFFYGLSHSNALNYPPSIEFYGDPLYLILLSVGPEKRDNKTEINPAVIISERDGDPLYTFYLKDYIKDLPSETLWVPYIGLSNPIDIDNDDRLDVIVSLRLYDKDTKKWTPLLVALELPPLGELK